MLDQQSRSMRGRKNPWLTALWAMFFPLWFAVAATGGSVVAHVYGAPLDWCVGAAVALVLPACLVARTRFVEFRRAVSALERSGARMAMHPAVSKLLFAYASTGGRRWVAFIACDYTLHFPPAWGEVSQSFDSKFAKPRVYPTSKSWWVSLMQPINYW